MGKSTFIAQNVAKYLARNKHNVASVFDPQGSFPYAEIPTELHDRLVRFRPRRNETELLELAPPGLIVIDDARIICPNHEGLPYYELGLNRRHAKNDILLIYHSLKKIHFSLLDFINRIYGFHVLDQYKTIANRVPPQVTKEYVDKLNTLAPYEVETLQIL